MKMKKLTSILLSAAMAVTLMAGCGASKPGEDGKKDGGKESKTNELALITDVGTIDDKSFNQGSWEGLQKYAKDHDKTCKYYKPQEKSTKACSDAIALAVKGGAKVIVTPGFLFNEAIADAQDKYPDVKFVFLDSVPMKGKKPVEIGKNVHCINYAEQEAGYLAGYAAVVEGDTQLGFMGGVAVPAVIRFGYGYIQGADAAAKELGLKKGDVTVKYTYVGNFDATPENETKAKSWFKEGTQCIFACGGGVGNSVMKAAESVDASVIGVDVDQSGESKTVITSAMKNLQGSVYDAVASVYDDKFEGGVNVILGAKDDGIMLPMENSHFKTFNQETYDKIYADLKGGKITLTNDVETESADKVPTDIVNVELIK